MDINIVDEDYLERIRKMFSDDDISLRIEFTKVRDSLNEHLTSKKDTHKTLYAYRSMEKSIEWFIANVLECMSDGDDMNLPDDVIEFYNKYCATEDEEEELKNETTSINDDQLINLFNGCKLIVPKIAENMGFPVYKVRSRIKLLQDRGILGKKDSTGKIVTKPKSSKKESSTQEGSLESLLSDIQNTAEAKQEISVHHKEMLIEILHKII